MVYVLLEFQSSIDRFMAVRVLTYVGLLYQDLIRASKNRDGVSLPAILPIVLHSGDKTWSVAEDFASLLDDVPKALQQYRPHLRYLLIELVSAFAVWLEKVILERLFDEHARITNKLGEKPPMLSERVREWEREFVEKGRQKGLQEGRQEGEAIVLMRLLQKRFGQLPDQVGARLRDASPEQLESWAECLLDAADLDAVFNGAVHS